MTASGGISAHSRDPTAAAANSAGRVPTAGAEPLARQQSDRALPQAGAVPAAPLRTAAPPPLDRTLPLLGPGDVHVWSLDLDAFAPTSPTLLSADEMDRASRLHGPPLRSRFMNGRGALRLLLGGYLETDPAALRFGYSALGKPNLSPPASPALFFNVSHSENAMLIAVTKIGAVGVDIEKRRPLPDEADLVKRFFQRDELTEYLSLPPALRTAGFFNGWTRKEAILKARGDGLGTPLDSFSVFLDPRRPCRIRDFLDLPEHRDEWLLLSFEPDQECTAALAIKARSVRLVQYRFGAPDQEPPRPSPVPDRRSTTANPGAAGAPLP